MPPNHRDTASFPRPARHPTLRLRAFSVVEFLAVIAVIGVSMTILIPSVRKSLRYTSATACMHRLRELHQALQAYQLDHGGWLPDVQEPRFGRPVDPHGVAWYGRLVPKYVAESSLLVCPADPARSLIDLDIPLDRHPDPANMSSYGLNDVIRVAKVGNLQRDGPMRPTETILLADLGPDHSRAIGDTIGGVRRSGGRLPWDDLYRPALAGLTSSWLSARHFGAINVLTIGGAVKPVPTTELMEEGIKSYYGDCATGGCPLCLDYLLPHYSFAPSRVYWWTGGLPHHD